jgi:hypothetical protein
VSAAAPSCLLVFPKAFYSFARVLAGELERRGYRVVTANEEYPENLFGKILGKLGLLRLLAWLTERGIERRFLRGTPHKLVVIVKGRGMGRRLLERLRRDGSRVVAYNFDSFSYHPAPLDWYQHVDRYATFDYADAERYGLPHVDLFSSLPEFKVAKQVRYDVSAILRNHFRPIGLRGFGPARTAAAACVPVHFRAEPVHIRLQSFAQSAAVRSLLEFYLDASAALCRVCRRIAQLRLHHRLRAPQADRHHDPLLRVARRSDQGDHQQPIRLPQPRIRRRPTNCLPNVCR